MLEQELKKILNGVYPFHMPGHKRQNEWLKGLYELDITEIAGADDLHDPSGLLADSMQDAAKLFGAKNTFFLTGGSTCGILSAISTACKTGDCIIIGRNCHKSVYNACVINRLNTYFVYPLPFEGLSCFGEVTPRQIAATMDESGAKTVVITSPTYEGVVSDIEGIATEVHKRDGLLIVDSAHGAHLGFNSYFPPSARTLGADIVIESAHKTLPCLTGAAFLHICSDRIGLKQIKYQLSVFETSSPPYPILCSIDRFLTEAQKTDLFSPYAKRLNKFYAAAQSFSSLKLMTSSRFDKGKLVISCKDSSISGYELKKILLEKYKLELEMAMPDYALAMTSPADTDEGFDRLLAALKEIDEEHPKTQTADGDLLHHFVAERLLPIFCDSETEIVAISSCLGRISSEFVYAYPPGSPIIAPGERITPAVLDHIRFLSSQDAHIYSSAGFFPDYLSVFKENY